MRRMSRTLAMIMTLLLLLPTTIFPSIAANGAIWTSDVHSSQDANVDYVSKLDVYVNAENFEPGNYWIRVVAPNGTELGRSTTANFVIGADGHDVGNTILDDGSSAYQLWSIVNKVNDGVVSVDTGYNDTNNAGGEYKVEIADNSDFTGKKSDNFKVIKEQYGSLEVMKTVVHSDPEGTLPAEMPDFEITVKGPKGFSETLYLTNGELETLNNLIPGKYYISETEPTGNYSFVSIKGLYDMTDVEVIIAEHQTVQVEVVNRYTPDPEPGLGALHICKWVITDKDIELPNNIPDFEVLVTGPNDYSETIYLTHNESITLNDLEPGLYKISEKSPSGEYSFVSINQTDTMTNFEIEVFEDETAHAEVVNKYTPCPDPDPELGSLLVCKWVITDQGITLPTTGPEFEILITGPDNYSKTVKLSHNEYELLEGLKPGNYFVSEIAPTAPYSFVSINDIDDMTDVEVVVAKNQEAKAEVVNKYTPNEEEPTGSIEILKFRDRNRDGIKNGSDTWLNSIQFRLEAAPEVDNDMSAMDAAHSWTMTTGSGDFEDGQIIFSGLPYGRYKLIELSPRTITAPEELKDGDMYVWVDEEHDTVLIEVGNYWRSSGGGSNPDPEPEPTPQVIETVPTEPIPQAPTVVEDVEEVVPDETPLADALPQTGELPPIGAYALGSLLVLTGVFMRRKSI